MFQNLVRPEDFKWHSVELQMKTVSYCALKESCTRVTYSFHPSAPAGGKKPIDTSRKGIEVS